MSCSSCNKGTKTSYEMPISYSSYPKPEATPATAKATAAHVSYASMARAGNVDHLNLDNMMPASWSQNTQNDDWAQYAPSKEAALRYTSTAGAFRFGMNSRSSTGRRFGTPNLLRPPVCCDVKPTDCVIFNDSSTRIDAIAGRYY